MRQNYGSYVNKMFERKILVFAMVWSLISFFTATAVAQILNAINTIMDFLLQVLIYCLSGPSLVAGYIPYFGGQTIARFIITFAIALLLAPVAYKIFSVILSIFKKSPF